MLGRYGSAVAGRCAYEEQPWQVELDQASLPQIAAVIQICASQFLRLLGAGFQQHHTSAECDLVSWVPGGPVIKKAAVA